MVDTYNTITAKIGEGYYTEKRSKFLAFALHTDSVEEAMDKVAAYKRKYYDARHVCYAYNIGTDPATFRANDDGEPSSTAGKPILNQINARQLTDVTVIVVRYYGGVNLGTGGLINASRTAAADALDKCQKETRIVEEKIEFNFTYSEMNDVMRIVKEMNPRIIKQHFDNTCSMTLAIRKSEANELRKRIKAIPFL